VGIESEGEGPIAVFGHAAGPGGEAKPGEAAENVDAGDLEATVALAGVGEGVDALQVGEVDAVKVASDAGDGLAEKAALEGSGQAMELVNIEDPGLIGPRSEEAGGLGAGGGLQVISILSGEFGGVGQEGLEGGVPLLLEEGQEDGAETVAGEGGVGVGEILTPGKTLGGGPGAEFSAGGLEEGAEEALGGDGEDTGESGGAGSAEEAE